MMFLSRSHCRPDFVRGKHGKVGPHESLEQAFMSDSAIQKITLNILQALLRYLYLIFAEPSYPRNDVDVKS